MPEKIAHLPDGTVLHFPDDTPDDIVASQVRSRIGITQTPSQTAAQTFPGAVNVAATIGKNLPSPATLASTGAGIGASYLTGSPFIGSAAMAGVSQLLNPESQNKTPLQNTGEMFLNTGLNELLGRGFSAVGKVGREIASPGSVLPQEMRSLLPFQPTAGQLSDSNILNLIENAFAGKSKQAAILRSAGIVNEQGEQLLRNLTGRPLITLNQPFEQAGNIQKGVEQQFDASKFESNKRGIAANLIAGANKIPWYNETIAGPIAPINLNAQAKAMLDDINKSLVKPDPNDPAVRALNDIINKTTLPQVQALTTQNAPLVRPISFGDMWETKKAIDDIAYNNPKSQTTFTDVRFKKLADAVNQDIEKSMPLWPNHGDAALQLFNESKQIVAQRNKLFGQAPIEKLVNDETKNIPSINSIIDDPKQLGKALITGNLVIPEGGTATQSNIKYITNNTRRDLQGYEIQRLINSAKYQDPKGNTLFDGQKLIDAFNDPNKQESYKLLFNQQNRADIQQFFKNINAVSEKGPTGMSRYWLMRMTGTGLGLGAGLLSGMGTLSASGTGIVSGTIGLNQLGKLLTNPNTARLMVSIAQGGPLNMPTMVASRAIANVLRNTPMTIEYQDGNKVDGKLDAQGKFTLPIGKGEIQR